jgi:hypothetical protein
MNTKTADALRTCINYNIEPLETVDRILPVVNSYRPASIILTTKYRRGVGVEEARSNIEGGEYFQSLRSQMSRFGVKVSAGTKTFVNPLLLRGKILLSRDDDLVQEVNELDRDAFEAMKGGEYSESYEKAVRLEGELLGYPSCCVDGFAKNDAEYVKALAGRGLIDKEDTPCPNPDRLYGKLTVMMQDIFGDCELTLQTALEAVSKCAKDKSYPFFTEFFYPCSIGCEKASEIGQRISQGYGSEHEVLGKIYDEIVIPRNILEIRSSLQIDPNFPCSHMLDRWGNNEISQRILHGIVETDESQVFSGLRLTSDAELSHLSSSGTGVMIMMPVYRSGMAGRVVYVIGFGGSGAHPGPDSDSPDGDPGKTNGG